MLSLFIPQKLTYSTSLGFLFLRCVVGLAFMFHGYGKIQNMFGWMGAESPVPGFLQALAALSEFGGGFLWVFGLLTPLASIGILCTMTVATSFHIFIKHDPFVAKGGSSFELSLVYLATALLFLLAGPGRYALDSLIFDRFLKKEKLPSCPSGQCQ